LSPKACVALRPLELEIDHRAGVEAGWDRLVVDATAITGWMRRRSSDVATNCGLDAATTASGIR